MKHLNIALAVVALWLNVATAAEPVWTTDVLKAVAKAKAEKKLVLLNFTGSDWCPWCIKLKQEVFSTPAFAAYAQTNLVLVEVDFPRHKQLPPAQKSYNHALQKKFEIEGYPTIIVLNGEGAKIGKLGYHAGGPAPFIAKLEKLKSKAEK